MLSRTWPALEGRSPSAFAPEKIPAACRDALDELLRTPESEENGTVVEATHLRSSRRGHQPADHEKAEKPQLGPVRGYEDLSQIFLLVFAPKARHFIQLDEPEFLFKEVETFLKENEATK